MTAPIGGIGAAGGVGGPRRIGLDIAGEGGLSRFQIPEGGTSFGDSLKRAIGEVSTQQETAQDYISRFVRGEPVELHQVMAASEEAQISLEMLVELRNKLMDAYKSVVNMG
ncbi:MAG: Flagellar hook-basal body complex protein fliE [Gemmatimonadetes bacterium]|nr:Flagellar hook-basal body complex protein fliE [Gemmatimonadota bacterium]